MKVLLPIDGSPFTTKMLEYITSTTGLFKESNEYVLVTIVTPLLPQSAGLLGQDAVDEYYEETSNKVLQPAIEFLNKKGLQCSAGFKVGYVSEALPDEAQAGQYDLVVMGAHGHGTLGSLILGSVANAMLSKTKIPVLLIR